MARGVDTRTTGQRARFIEHLALTANVTASCAVAGFDRNAAYRMRDNDPEFAEAWKDALERAVDTLEAEAWRRARDGTEEYITCKDGLVFDQEGRPVMQRKYSDTLMVTLLKAHRPDRFRDRSTVDVNMANLSEAMDEARKRARGQES